jgi:hypothetical protein
MNKAPALALVALVLLTAACFGDSSPKPTVTPRATQTVAPGASPIAVQPSPSLTVEPSPTPAATATAPVPTETATPLPTPTPTARPDGFQFHFGPDVSAFDRSLITRAVEVTSELLSTGAGVQPPSAVFADSSLVRLEASYAEHALAQKWRSQGMASRMRQAIAEASYRGIVINTGDAWETMDPTERLRVVAHEYVHVIQLEHAGEDVADETFRRGATMVPPAGPFWLLEGSAEVVSWLVLQELNLGSYPEPLFDYAAEVSGSDLSLEDLATFLGYREGGQEGLGLSVLAVDYLLRTRDLESLFDFWSHVSVRTPWSAPFARDFGLSPADFYDAFALYYEATWAGFTN